MIEFLTERAQAFEQRIGSRIFRPQVVESVALGTIFKYREKIRVRRKQIFCDCRRYTIFVRYLCDNLQWSQSGAIAEMIHEDLLYTIAAGTNHRTQFCIQLTSEAGQ